jgi:hypothetical protein
VHYERAAPHGFIPSFGGEEIRLDKTQFVEPGPAGRSPPW